MAFTMFVSALNVRYRDVQHLIGLALLVWFWMTPIVYAAVDRVRTSMLGVRARQPLLWRVYLLNPLTWVVMGFQRALYHSGDDPLCPGAVHGGAARASRSPIVSAIALVAVYLAWRLYFSMSGDFAEEL